MLVALGTALLTLGGLTAAFHWSGDRARTGADETPVDAELIMFHQSGGADLPSLATVLRSGTDAKAARAWFAQSDKSDEFAESVEGRDYRREAVLVFSFQSGCTSGKGANLYAEGSNLSVKLTHRRTLPECEAPYRNLVVFAVDKAKVPENVTLANARFGRPDDPSPARLVTFTKLSRRPAGSQRAAEVSQPDQLDAFVKTLPVLPGATLGIDDDRGPGDRRFAFVVSACRARTAILTISDRRLAAEPVGADAERCTAPDHYVAIFDIEGRYVPPTATIG
ncbi:MAG TPA: hypothetical protein VIL71_13760 [Spirillospora sp.]